MGLLVILGGLSPGSTEGRNDEYFSWFQVERTSTWNHHTLCTYGKAKT